MQGKDVQAISETNVFIYRDLASASAGSLLCGAGISRRTLSEEHVPLWAQIWFTTTSEINVVQNDITLEGDIAKVNSWHIEY